MIGLATIGQAPRDDVTPVMFSPALCTGVLQAGALDALSRIEIDALRPNGDEHPLVTRLRSGEEVVIAKERVLPHLQAAVRRLEADGARLVCILCTGEFNLTSGSARLIYPDRLVGGVVDSILPAGKLGVVIPHAGQRKSMERKWNGDGRQVAIQVLSPYQGEANRCEPLDQLAAAGVDLIVLDCMGYGLDVQELAANAVNVPVILSNRLVGAVIESMAVQPEGR